MKERREAVGKRRMERERGEWRGKGEGGMEREGRGRNGEGKRRMERERGEWRRKGE